MNPIAASNGPLTRPLSAALTRTPASENTEQRNKAIDEILASQPGVSWIRAGKGPDRLVSGAHFACVGTFRVRFTHAHAVTKGCTVRTSDIFGRLCVNRAAF
jgi:hypothetical protein